MFARRLEHAIAIAPKMHAIGMRLATLMLSRLTPAAVIAWWTAEGSVATAVTRLWMADTWVCASGVVPCPWILADAEYVTGWCSRSATTPAAGTINKMSSSQRYRQKMRLIASLASMGGWSSNHWALTQRLAGVNAAGKWTGFQNCIGNFAGVLSNWVSGATYDRMHSFVPAFTLAAAAMVTAVIGYWFCIRHADPVNLAECHIPQKNVAYTLLCY